MLIGIFRHRSQAGSHNTGKFARAHRKRFCTVDSE
jgi:hypothetical protein